MTDSGTIGKLTSQIAATTPFQRPSSTTPLKEAESKSGERSENKKRTSGEDIVETSDVLANTTEAGANDEFSAVSGPDSKADLSEQQSATEPTHEELVGLTAQGITSSPALAIAGQALNLDAEKVHALTA